MPGEHIMSDLDMLNISEITSRPMDDFIDRKNVPLSTPPMHFPIPPMDVFPSLQLFYESSYSFDTKTSPYTTPLIQYLAPPGLLRYIMKIWLKLPHKRNTPYMVLKSQVAALFGNNSPS